MNKGFKRPLCEAVDCVGIAQDDGHARGVLYFPGRPVNREWKQPLKEACGRRQGWRNRASCALCYGRGVLSQQQKRNEYSFFTILISQTSRVFSCKLGFFITASHVGLSGPLARNLTLKKAWVLRLSLKVFVQGFMNPRARGLPVILMDV